MKTQPLRYSLRETEGKGWEETQRGIEERESEGKWVGGMEQERGEERGSEVGEGGGMGERRGREGGQQEAGTG